MKVRVDADLVQQFATGCTAWGNDVLVRRVARWADGICLVVQSGERTAEWAFVIAGGGGWAWALESPGRERLLRAVEREAPELAQPAKLEWRARDATALDALRAWLVRPAAAPGAWSRLEGMRLRSVTARTGDRVVELVFEREDAVGRVESFRFIAQLFDRGGNVHFLERGDELVVALYDRPIAAIRAAGEMAAPVPAPRASIDLALAAHRALATIAADELLRIETRRLRRDVAHLERLVGKLREEDTGAAAAQRDRQDAELLTANLHRIKRGQARVEVEDWFADNAPRVLELDPKLSTQENIARLFKRAKRGERGQETIATRRAENETRLAEETAALAGLPEAPSSWTGVLDAAPAALRALAPRAATTPLASLWAPGGPERESAPEKPTARRDEAPGRRFVLNGDWEVRVGRSNGDNDQLTHKFARPDDVWLHASGVAGSHVVLRMAGRDGNPPRDVLEQAAALAARFSKAKHAGTVPVVWTRKRYVRKPRGAPAGQAICTHEKTVFVKPALPEGTPDED